MIHKNMLNEGLLCQWFITFDLNVLWVSFYTDNIHGNTNKGIQETTNFRIFLVTISGLIRKHCIIIFSLFK